MGDRTKAAAWFAELAQSVAGLDVYGLGIVVIDLADGAVVGATSTATELLGGPVATTDDLVARGTIARPDLRSFRRELLRWRATLTDGAAESSHSWSDDVRVHRGDAPWVIVHVELVVHRRPAVGAEAAVVTLWPVDDLRPTSGRAEQPVLDEVWAIYDEQLLMVAADPAFADLGIDPASQIGAHAWMYAHPEDVPSVQPLVAEVLAGRRRQVTYSVRLRARDSRWVPAHIEVRRLDGPGGASLVVIARYVDTSRRLIPPGTLTRREATVVDALFDGLRVSQIAERDGAAVKTVRHHLASVYRKLDVAGQVELLAAYHRPTPPA